MSNIKVETTEPDPAATSFPNDEMINKEGGDPSAPTDKETIVADAKSKETNGKVEAEEKQMKEENRYLKEVKDEKNEEKTDEKTEEKTEENGTTQKKNPRTYENGVLKTSGQVQEGRGVKNSKYDPSILPTTDDPSKIRAQV
jgi:lupus La protein